MKKVIPAVPASQSEPRLTLGAVRHDLDNVGCAIRKNDCGEYRVNFRAGVEATAYYTDDLRDALATGRDMAKRGNPYRV